MRTAGAVAALAALAALTLSLTACGGDDEPSVREPTAAASADAALDPALVEELTSTYLGRDEACPDGSYREVDDVLTTLSEPYVRRATSLRSYSCGDLVDQAVLAEYPDAETAAGLLDDEETGYYAATFVAGDTALAVNNRVVLEGGVDVAALFDELAAECGCGETLYEGG